MTRPSTKILRILSLTFLLAGFGTARASDQWGDNGSTPVGGGTNNPAGGTDPGSNSNGDKNGKGKEAEPIDLFTGQFETDATDINIPGRISLMLQRHYRSGSTYQGPFGLGWNFEYNERLLVTATNGDLILRAGNSSRDYFLNRGDNTFAPPRGRYDSLSRNGDGTYTLRSTHGMVRTFSSEGFLTEVRDRNWNQLLLSYQPGKQPINAVSDFSHFTNAILVARDYRIDRIQVAFSNSLSGRYLQFYYDPNGRVTNVTDFTGRAWKYAYDGSGLGELLSVTGPPVPGFPSGLTVSYTYSVTNLHHLETATDPAGQQYLTNFYDASGFVTKQLWGSAGYTFAHPSATNRWVTNANGFKIERNFDTNGNVLTLKQYTAGVRPGDPSFYLTSYSYNTNNELAKILLPAGNVRTNRYDSSGNLLEVRRKATDTTNSSADLVLGMSYEPNFNFIKTSTDPSGNVTTYVYDYETGAGRSNGNIARIIYPAISGTNPVVGFSYNQFGQLDTSTNQVGTLTKFIYDPTTGYLLQRIDAFGTSVAATNAFTYDARGNVLTSTDPRGNTTTYQYDLIDRLTNCISAAPFNFVTKYTYTPNGKLAKMERQTGDGSHPWQTTAYGYDVLDRLSATTNDLGQTTQIAYDPLGNRTRVTDGNGNFTLYTYDERNLVFKILDALTNVVQYNYRANGNLAQFIDGRTNATSYGYDAYDRLTAVTYPDATTELFVYEPSGNLVAKGLRNASWITNSFDALNRLIFRLYSDSTTVQYQYDLANRPTATIDTLGTNTITYDSLGRVIGSTNDFGKVVAYEFDGAGNRTKLIYPDGSYVTYNHDSLNRLTNILYGGTNLLAGFSFDPLNRRTQLNYGNGTRGSYAYDWANRLTNVTHIITNTSTVLGSFGYSYDNAGNRLSLAAASVAFAGTHNYGYDATYQLTNADYPLGFPLPDTTFNYDSARNRTRTIDGGTTNYSINNLNQYTTVGGRNYSYNFNGNLSADGPSTAYLYDDLNRLTFVARPGVTVTYSYDARGHRLEKNVNGAVTRYVYAGSAVIAETDFAGNILRRYVHGRGVDTPLIMFDGTNRYYYHAVALRTIFALTGSSGNKVEEYTYGAYGSLLSGTPATANRFLFAGREFDSETGFYFLRNRHYHPGLGRFIQPDPIGYMGGNNLYAYCDNNPLAWMDPFGFDKDQGWLDRNKGWLVPVGIGVMIVADIFAPELIPFEAELGEGLGIGVEAGEAGSLVAEGAEVAAADDAPIILGENMERVQAYADEVGGKTINDFIPKESWTKEANEAWIQQMKAEGRELIDIGPDFARRAERIEQGIRPDSEIYNMERMHTKDYDGYNQIFNRSGKYQGGVPGFDW